MSSPIENCSNKARRGNFSYNNDLEIHSVVCIQEGAIRFYRKPYTISPSQRRLYWGKTLCYPLRIRCLHFQSTSPLYSFLILLLSLPDTHNILFVKRETVSGILLWIRNDWKTYWHNISPQQHFRWINLVDRKLFSTRLSSERHF